MFITGSLFFPLRVAKSRIHGNGAYAIKRIPARRKIGSLGGEVISQREGRKRAQDKTSISIVELWNGKTLDASAYNHEIKFINHSCQPNTFMRTLGYHVEFYALRDIAKDEELTCNYGETHHNGTKKCNCGATSCKGFM